MAFPTVVGSPGIWDSAGAAVNDVNATIPSGVAAGDILLCFQTRSDVNNGGTLDSFWTGSGIIGIPGAGNGRCAYHVCTGSESGTVAFSNISIADAVGTICYLVRGVVGVPEGGGAVTATATVNADPGNLAPSWGLADVLLFIYGFTSTGARTATLPGSYGNATTQNSNIGSSSAVVARRTATVSSEDPGAIVWSASGDVGSFVVALQGARPRAFGTIVG